MITFFAKSVRLPYEIRALGLYQFLRNDRLFESPAKPLKAVENRHSGQAKRDPESRIFKLFWIPAPAPDPDPGFARRSEQLLQEAHSSIFFFLFLTPCALRLAPFFFPRFSFSIDSHLF
jgi:hypothetical protein